MDIQLSFERFDSDMYDITHNGVRIGYMAYSGHEWILRTKTPIIKLRGAYRHDLMEEAEIEYNKYKPNTD